MIQLRPVMKGNENNIWGTKYLGCTIQRLYFYSMVLESYLDLY